MRDHKNWVNRILKEGRKRTIENNKNKAANKLKREIIARSKGDINARKQN